jgi:hypothetical protein
MSRKELSRQLVLATAVALLAGLPVLWWLSQPVITSVVREVRLHPDGTMEVVTMPIPRRRVLSQDGLPRQAPVFTVISDSDVRPGVVLYNDSDRHLRMMRYDAPVLIHLQSDGTYTLLTDEVTVWIDDGTIWPGRALKPRGPMYVPIKY